MESFNKTNEDEQKRRIELFTNTIYKYLDYFGLKNFRIDIEKGSNDCYGECNYHITSKTATIKYGISLIENQNINDNQIKKTAFHEVMELLLSKLSILSYNISYPRTENEVDEEVHNIIRTMENTVFNDINI
jgi:hypothetical protein